MTGGPSGIGIGGRPGTMSGTIIIGEARMKEAVLF
jgi:hypothetical protein